MSYPPPLQPQYYSPPGGQPLPTGLSIASMVCGIVSLVGFCLWYLSIPLAIVALILGIVARGQVRRGVAGGGGMAMAGIICSSIALAIDLILVILLIVGVTAAGMSGGLHHP